MPGALATHEVEGVLEASPDAVLVCRLDGSILFANQRAVALSGYSIAELLAANVAILVPERLRGTYATYQRYFETSPVARVPWHDIATALLRQDGDEVPLNASLAPFSRGDQPMVVVTGRDARKQRDQQRAQALFMRIAAVASHDADPREALAEALAAITDAAAADRGHISEHRDGQLSSTGIWYGDALDEVVSALSAERRPGDGDIAHSVLVSAGLVWHTDLAADAPSETALIEAGVRAAAAFPIRVADEVTHVVELYYADARPPEGRVVAILEQVGRLLGRIAERQRARADRALTETLREQNRELQLFAHAASHDLREPLRMVTSFLDLLRKRYADVLDERANRYIDFAAEGAARMTALIRSLLQYTEADRHAEPLVRCSLGRVVASARANLNESIRERGATLQIPSDLPHVRGDETLLVQLFQNLLANALKFHDGSAVVRLEAERRADRWCIRVCDNGIGIAPEHRERVFEMFTRLHERDRFPGSGIGLATCRRIVERHGGEIWLDSEPGEGTTVSFTLPVDEATP